MSKFFKRKKQTKERDSKVYMPYRKSEAVPVRKRKKNNSFKRRNNIIKRRRKKLNILSLLLYIFIPLVFLSLLYISVLSVFRIRSEDSEEDLELQYVIGIDDVPTFPKSEFIFTNSINETSVANFISSGNSAYRIPLDKNILEVYKYYNDTLPDYGWEHVLSVEVGSEEMKSGEYWVNNEKGLRIYSKFNDVWYELITPVQAYSGLRERVEREVERDLLLKSEQPQDLLPDFEWSLEVPREYVVSYSALDYESLRAVEFRKLGSEERVTITPIGKGGSALDNYLSSYIEDINQNREDGDWTITNTVLTYTNYGKALKGTIASGSLVHDVAVIPNTYNNVMYVMESNGLENPFFDFIFSNLTPQGVDQGDSN